MGKYLQRGVREEECHMKGEGEEKQENALWEPISVLLPAPPTLKLVVLDLYPFFFLKKENKTLGAFTFNHPRSPAAMQNK